MTALHKDNYENVYVQIIGQKHFVLLPPLTYACVAEKELCPATYVRDGSGGLRIEEDEVEERVPFATWDPDVDGESAEWRGTKYSKYAEPMRVTLGEGDMLYLPALWSVKCSALLGLADIHMLSGIIKSVNHVRKKGFAVRSITGMTWSLVVAFIHCVIMFALLPRLYSVEKVEAEWSWAKCHIPVAKHGVLYCTIPR